MHTYWIVEEVVEKPGIVLATLASVEWYKKNPDWEAHADDDGGTPDGVDEFIEALPGEEGADYIESDGPRITLDLTEGPDLHPLDNVEMSIALLASADV